MSAERLDFLPNAYLETAEFDCLHDEGVAYARALCDAGTEVVVNETRGTMHGYDIVEKAPTTIASVAERIRCMQMRFLSVDKSDDAQ